MHVLSALPYHITLPVGFFAGLLLGFVYFRALRETAALIVSRSRPMIGFALTMARLAMLVVVFYVAALAGGLALLAALAGVLCGKALILRRIGSEGT